MSKIIVYIISFFTLSNIGCMQFEDKPDDFPRWESLFNGKDTQGWTVAKEGHQGEWAVENEQLVRKDAVDICTIDEFENYELEIEFKSGPTGTGNSGVYLRGQVEVQIFNSTYHKKKGEELKASDGSAIYNLSAPLVNAHNKQGEWNKYRIMHNGKTVNVWLNGMLVQSNVEVNSPTPGCMNKHPITGKPLKICKGPLMLQGDHDRVWFRNIRIRRIPKGWKPLWNGKDLSEFQGERMDEGWRVDNNTLTNQAHITKNIASKKSYGNFLLHYEYKSNPDTCEGNSGLSLRSQWEVQILTEQDPKKKESDGSLWSVKAPDCVATNGPNAWNSMDVMVVRNIISIWQNDKCIHNNVEINERTGNGDPTPEFSKAPFILQGDHGEVWFRGLYVKELPDG